MTSYAKTSGTAVITVAAAVLMAMTPALTSAKPQPQQSDNDDAHTLRDQQPQLQEVIVTAEKRREDVNKVPISMSVYTSAAMQAQGIRNINDIVQLTPGVAWGDNRGISQRLVIRGVSSRAGAATSSIYIDDIPVDAVVGILNLVGTASPKVFDLDRVEVLRGPQGTLFGAGAEGGAIRFITAKPSLTKSSGFAESDVSLTQGGDFSYESGVADGGPIASDKLGYRFSAWARHGGGYVDHESFLPGGHFERNANWQNEVALHGALTFAPVNALKITPSLFFQRSKANDSGFFDPPVSDVSRNHFVNANALTTPIHDEFYLPSLTIEADLGPVTLTDISSYMHRHSDATLDYTNVIAGIFGVKAAPTIADAAPVAYGNVQDIVTHELRLQSADPNARLKWTIGAFFETAREAVTEDIYNPSLPQMSEQYFGMPVETAFGAPMVGDYSFVATDVIRNRQLAAFGQIDYRLYGPLTLVAGARYAKLNNDFTFGAAGPIEGATVAASGGQHQNSVTPKYGLNYQINPNNLVYVSAAKGDRLGGANTPIEATPACLAELNQLEPGGTPKTYNSDSLWSYEVGSKNSLFDKRAQIDASAYYMDWKNIQQTIYLPSCLSAFVANVGEAKIDGFDLQVNTAVTERFHVGLDIGYTNAKVAKTTGVPGTNAIYAYKGDQIDLYSQPWTYVGVLEYRLRAFGHDALARVDDEYHPKNPGPFTNLSHPNGAFYDPRFQPLPATNMLNARLSTFVGNLELTGYVTNALNTHPFLYDLSFIGIGGSALGDTFTFQPRTFGINGVYRW